jgi:hypothetical protein
LQTSMSVMCCHLFIATNHLSPFRRQLQSRWDIDGCDNSGHFVPDIDDESILPNRRAYSF